MSYASTAVNGVKQATTTTAYANAVKNLSLRQAELALSTKNLSAEQQREILVTAGLIKETGTLTVAQATEALTTDTRNAADVEALMLKAGLITELGAETTATITVDAAKLKELVDTKVLTQAEAELLAMKAGVTLQSTKEAATLIASNAKLGSSFAIIGKTAGAALKGIGTGLLSFASAHPLIAALVGVVSIVGLVTTGTKKLREEQEQAIETARSLQEEYRSSTKSLSDNISSLESQKDEFERLSKGVDDYGKNISLSSDEYDRYKSIVSEILGYSPELIQGYDAEGNAIANKNSLIERSIELMKEEQRQKLKEMTTDEKTKTAYEGAKADWEQTKGYDGANTRNDIARWFNDNAMSGGWNYEVDIAEILGIKDEWKEEGNNLQNAIINNIETVAKNIKEKKAELLALKDENGNALFTETEIDAMIDQADTWQQQYADWQRDIEDAKHGMDNQFELYAQKADGYNDLTDAQKAFVNEYIKATGDIIDADGNLLSEDEIIKKAEGYTKFVEKLANDRNFEEARTKINTLFSLDKSQMSASEYEKQVNAILKELQDKFNLTDDEVMDFKIALGFTFTSDGKTQTGELLDQVKGKLKDEFDGKADELTLEELQIAAKIVADIPEGTLLSWDELQDKIKETQWNANKMTVSLSELESASDKIGKLSSAFKEFSDDGYITTKTLGELQTATGLSGDKWAEYENRLLNAKKGSADFNQVLSELTYKILESEFATINLTNASNEEITAIENKITAILRENGVTNANAVAHDYVKKTVLNAKLAKADFSKGVDGVVSALYEEVKWLGLTEGEVKDLASVYASAQQIMLDAVESGAAGRLGILKSELEGITGIAEAYALLSKNGSPSYDPTGKGNPLVGSELARLNDEQYAAYLADRQKIIAYGNAVEALKKIQDIDITIPNYRDPSSSSSNSSKNSTNSSNDSTSFDDSYYSTLDAWIEENEKQIDKFEKDREVLNRQFENALDTGNKEQAEILRAKLAENAKTQKDILHQQNEAHRITQGNLLQSLYLYAPELKDKSWGEISEVDLINIENALNRASETASDDNKNQAKYNLNQFKGIVDDLKTLNDTIEKKSESWWKLDDDSKGYWQSLIQFQDDYSNTWIDNQKAFDKLSEEEELAAYGRMVNNNKEFQKQILNDTSLTEESKLALIKETNDKIIEIEKTAYDLVKEMFSDATNLGSSYLGSKKTLLQSYYDITNSIAEAQHEINKELEASKTMYEYLNKDTQKLLFNQKDYNILSEELYDIQYKAEKLKKQYERDLKNSTLNTIEEITSNYEMQYETLMKSYEIAKADLEIAKKKQQLNNVLKERNVRMFIDGQWQWVANTEDVINAKSELADAEYAQKTATATLRQTNSLNELTAQQDKLGTIISKFEDGVIDLDDAIKDITKSFIDIPTAVESLLYSLKSDSKTSTKSSSKSSASDKEFVSYVQSQMKMNSEAWHKTNSQTEKDRLNSLNIMLGESIGLKYDSLTGTYKKYADGTNYTRPGSALMGEAGFETFINNNGHLIPITQPTLANIGSGGIVFNTEQMTNLRSLWDLSNVDKITSNIPSFTERVQKIDNSNCNNVIINGMTVDSGSSDGQALINALRRYTATH